MHPLCHVLPSSAAVQIEPTYLSQPCSKNTGSVSSGVHFKPSPTPTPINDICNSHQFFNIVNDRSHVSGGADGLPCHQNRPEAALESAVTVAFLA